MSVSNLMRPPPSTRRRRRGTSPCEPSWSFVRVYLACLAICVLSLLLLPLTPLAYLASGWYISRYVSDRVDWCPLTGTLHNIARAKWMMMLMWPWQLPRLIWDSLRVRYL
jgi:hypothetical protein